MNDGAVTLSGKVAAVTGAGSGIGRGFAAALAAAGARVVVNDVSADGLDETYRQEDWSSENPGRAYYDVHLSVIEKYETATPVFREYLAAGGLRILESGCGSGTSSAGDFRRRRVRTAYRNSPRRVVRTRAAVRTERDTARLVRNRST